MFVGNERYAGQQWGASFRMTRKIDILFGGMGQVEGDKEAWMKDNSVLVDCLNVALRDGGIMKEEVVV